MNSIPSPDSTVRDLLDETSVGRSNPCLLCNFSTDSESELSQHIEERHPEIFVEIFIEPEKLGSNAAAAEAKISGRQLMLRPVLTGFRCLVKGCDFRTTHLVPFLLDHVSDPPERCKELRRIQFKDAKNINFASADRSGPTFSCRYCMYECKRSVLLYLHVKKDHAGVTSSRATGRPRAKSRTETKKKEISEDLPSAELPSISAGNKDLHRKRKRSSGQMSSSSNSSSRALDKPDVERVSDVTNDDSDGKRRMVAEVVNAERSSPSELFNGPNSPEAPSPEKASSADLGSPTVEAMTISGESATRRVDQPSEVVADGQDDPDEASKGLQIVPQSEPQSCPVSRQDSQPTITSPFSLDPVQEIVSWSVEDISLSNRSRLAERVLQPATSSTVPASIEDITLLDSNPVQDSHQSFAHSRLEDQATEDSSTSGLPSPMETSDIPTPSFEGATKSCSFSSPEDGEDSARSLPKELEKIEGLVAPTEVPRAHPNVESQVGCLGQDLEDTDDLVEEVSDDSFCLSSPTTSRSSKCAQADVDGVFSDEAEVEDEDDGIETQHCDDDATTVWSNSGTTLGPTCSPQTQTDAGSQVCLGCDEAVEVAGSLSVELETVDLDGSDEVDLLPELSLTASYFSEPMIGNEVLEDDGGVEDFSGVIKNDVFFGSCGNDPVLDMVVNEALPDQPEEVRPWLNPESHSRYENVSAQIRNDSPAADVGSLRGHLPRRSMAGKRVHSCSCCAETSLPKKPQPRPRSKTKFANPDLAPHRLDPGVVTTQAFDVGVERSAAVSKRRSSVGVEAKKRRRRPNTLSKLLRQLPKKIEITEDFSETARTRTRLLLLRPVLSGKRCPYCLNFRTTDDPQFTKHVNECSAAPEFVGVDLDDVEQHRKVNSF